jgi:hypothetical protein
LIEKFPLLDSEQLRAAWPERPDQASMASFNVDDVPENLRSLVPYAQCWGIEDSLEREKLMLLAPAGLSSHVVRALRSYQAELDDWLAGEESWSANPSDAYVAFSILCMTAELLSAPQRK